MGERAGLAGQESQIKRTKHLLVDQCFVMRDFGQKPELIQRAGNDVGVGALPCNASQIGGARVTQPEVDEALREEVLRPRVVVVRLGSGFQVGVELAGRLARTAPK